MFEALSEAEGAPDVVVPRASLVLPRGPRTAAIWMGGARALRGDEVRPSDLAGGWLVDAAGDMPSAHRAAATRLIDCVFADNEETPPGFLRVQELVREISAAATSGGPLAICLVCSQGLNRSGLLTGLVLRQMGFSANDTVARIRAARPGSLANHAYERLIHEARP